MVHLAADLHGLGEGLGAHGHQHELLESQGVAGVLAAVDHVHRGHGQYKLVLSGHVSEELVQRDLLSRSTGLHTGERGTQNSVGTELALVLRSVQLEHQVIDGVDVGHIHAADVGSNDGLHVVDRLGHALSVVGLTPVTKFKGFVNTSGGSARDRGSKRSVLGGNVDLDGGVTTGI